MTQRRGNGLLADAYVPLVRLPTSRADLMLEALRRAGIAAYAAPLEGDVLEPAGPGTDDPATDHLYVDAAERGAAEGILRTELPDLAERAVDGGGYESSEYADQADPATASDTGPLERMPTREPTPEDDAWADLVARFYDSDSTTEGTSWPDAENLSAEEQREREEGERADEPTGPDVLDDSAASRVVRPARSDDSAGAGGDSEEHYVPPEPPPFPRGDLVSKLSWGGLFGGPVLLLGSMLVGITLPGWLAFCAVAGFIAGFVVLVVRMSDHRPPGDGGAVV
ncbi:hypothetical protein F4561_001657 [Lipingzhangella halophila]|uniref:Uncharacterized protein n=1 Tax=Lipingzhangella halophila TaxID=1783352 RepID=A0A7W7W1D2_9ACTN|nr:hypothetical protein [Lipingzhangella halophila]MBB4930837.1 hypothetical protein [Lipingzhangella halophila]